MTGEITFEQQLPGRQTGDWLRCEASPGQFPKELAITGKMASGRVFSLFAHETYVFCDSQPSEGRSVSAWLRVDIICEQDGNAVIRLPRQTLENGQFVVVKQEQVRRETARQES
jgi:hypothetical protein